MPTINNNRRKLICVSQPLSMKYVSKITFAQSKRFPPEHKLSTRQRNKQHFGMSKSRVLPTLSSSSRETAVKNISIWVFFFDLERDTNFTLQNQSAVKGQKLGLCL